MSTSSPDEDRDSSVGAPAPRCITIVGAGWAGLSAAHHLLLQHQQYQQPQKNSSNSTTTMEVTLVDAAPRVGGLVRDGFASQKQQRDAEAGQHGFWRNYRNIYKFLNETYDLWNLLSDYAPQGQYSPRGLEAVWPVYQDQQPRLPTGLAQLLYTDFLGLPLEDRLTALPLVLAFSEFDNSPEAWDRYDKISFRDLCVQLGVSDKCYDEAFEPMILTGLFAPGRNCSAAAALGMAYFFVLQSQCAFDVQWCRGNIGDRIFQPWVDQMKEHGLRLECATRVVGFDVESDAITAVQCRRADGSQFILPSDDVILCVSAKALNSFAQFCPNLAQYDEFRGFANLRGTSVLATRIYLDKTITALYSANACWGFHKDVGMTFFDIRALHGSDDDDGTSKEEDGVRSVFEVDYYYADRLLALSDDDLIQQVKQDLNALLGIKCEQASVLDAAIVRLPGAVNWYFPGSYQYLPDLRSRCLSNLYYAGVVVKSDHGSWSQEKAFVTGMEAANVVLGRSKHQGVLPLDADEAHVQLGRLLVNLSKSVVGGGNPWKAPSLLDWLKCF